MNQARDLTLTLVQTDIAWEAPQRNLDRLDATLSTLGDTDLIVLPEMFSTGFTMNPVAVAETMDGRTVNWLRDTARARRADIMGSVVIGEEGRYFNRLVWAGQDGSLACYDKRHLFTFAGEHRHYCAGTEPRIVPFNGWSVATFICYDLRFPEWSRNLDGKYDLAVYIASWPERRSRHWQALLTARAIENQCYVVGVNRIGTDGNGLSYSGDSMLIDPLGEVLFHEKHAECLHTAVLSHAKLNDVRETFPFLKDADRFELSK
ncbi:amidohydrolase [Paludibacterium paludis]|uniref:Omega-amidase YafV n=1 Tax=Paludibacterium paludis TaxID=1225769 RepID=A0A918P2L9_9NEIS|nr:amidohydrolase [Paludibacterium paludis]GGY14809.1 carbon-nitrogen hydrolase [Paludibacterium paludis]